MSPWAIRSSCFRPAANIAALPSPAIARSGVGAVDSTRIYCHARVAQTPSAQAVSGLHDRLQIARPGSRAGIGANISRQLFQHEALSWQDREEANLQLFLTLRVSAAITVSLIILLAGFGIFNVLTMSVLSKIKEIAILRSMGYRRQDIARFFSGKAR